MTPFEVDAEEDVGYVANASLAGSRMNTALRDTAASISVLTSEFLSDVGATNLTEALKWSNNLPDAARRLPQSVCRQVLHRGRRAKLEQG